MISIHPAIQNMTFDTLKRLILASKKKEGEKEVKELTTLEALTVATFSSFTTLLITFPLIMAKTRIQSQSAEKKLYRGTLDVLVKAFKANGVLGLYQGLSTQLFKSIATNVILLTTKEKITKYTFALISFILRFIFPNTKK